MIYQTSQPLTFTFQFTKGKVGYAPTPAPTVNVWIVGGASLEAGAALTADPHAAGGYYYTLPSGSTGTPGIYRAQASTTDTTPDSQIADSEFIVGNSLAQAVPSVAPATNGGLLTAGFGFGSLATDSTGGAYLARGEWQNVAKATCGRTYRNVWFVDPVNGSDGFSGISPVAAVAAGPFATILHAITVAAAGDLILLSSGDHSVTGNVMRLPDHVSMLGQGRRVTRILCTVPIAGNGSFLKLPSYAMIGRFSLIGDQTAGNFVGPMGYDTSAGETPPVQCEVEDVECIDWSDGMYFRAKAGEVASVTGRRCVFSNGYDSVNIIANASNDIGTVNLDLYDCVAEGAGVVGRSEPVRGFVHEANGLMRVFGGRVDLTHAGSGAVLGVATVQNGANAPVVRCYGLQIFTADSGGGHHDVSVGAGSITLTDCGYDPSSLSGGTVRPKPVNAIVLPNPAPAGYGSASLTAEITEVRAQ